MRRRAPKCEQQRTDRERHRDRAQALQRGRRGFERGWDVRCSFTRRLEGLGSVFKKESHRSVVDLVVVFDLVVDGAVDMSATFVNHVDDSTVIIFVSIATTASKSTIPRS